MQKNNDIPIGARLSNLDKIFKESVRSYCNKHGLNFTYSKIIMMLHRHPEGVIQNDIKKYGTRRLYYKSYLCR